MGIYFDSIPEIVYTASEDKRLKVYKLDKNTVTAGNLILAENSLIAQ